MCIYIYFVLYQRKIPQEIHHNAYKDWAQFVQRRSAEICNEGPIHIDLCKLAIETYLRLERSKTNCEPSILIRTWNNGWTTSWRMNERIRLQYICGCDGSKDILVHYCACPRMWEIIADEFGIAPGRLCVRGSARAAPSGSSYRSFAMLAVAFKAYHYLKIDRYDDTRNACNSGTFECFRRLFAQ